MRREIMTRDLGEFKSTGRLVNDGRDGGCPKMYKELGESGTERDKGARKRGLQTKRCDWHVIIINRFCLVSTRDRFQ